MNGDRLQSSAMLIGNSIWFSGATYRQVEDMVFIEGVLGGIENSLVANMQLFSSILYNVLHIFHSPKRLTTALNKKRYRVIFFLCAL